MAKTIVVYNDQTLVHEPATTQLNAELVGNELRITLPDDQVVTVDLSTLTPNVDYDQVKAMNLNGKTLTLVNEDNSTVDVDLSPLSGADGLTCESLQALEVSEFKLGDTMLVTSASGECKRIALDRSMFPKLSVTVSGDRNVDAGSDLTRTFRVYNTGEEVDGVTFSITNTVADGSTIDYNVVSAVESSSTGVTVTRQGTGLVWTIDDFAKNTYVEIDLTLHSGSTSTGVIVSTGIATAPANSVEAYLKDNVATIATGISVSSGDGGDGSTEACVDNNHMVINHATPLQAYNYEHGDLIPTPNVFCWVAGRYENVGTKTFVGYSSTESNAIIMPDGFKFSDSAITLNLTTDSAHSTVGCSNVGLFLMHKNDTTTKSYNINGTMCNVTGGSYSSHIGNADYIATENTSIAVNGTEITVTIPSLADSVTALTNNASGEYTIGAVMSLFMESDCGVIAYDFIIYEKLFETKLVGIISTSAATHTFSNDAIEDLRSYPAGRAANNTEAYNGSNPTALLYGSNTCIQRYKHASSGVHQNAVITASAGDSFQVVSTQVLSFGGNITSTQDNYDDTTGYYTFTITIGAGATSADDIAIPGLLEINIV